MNSIETKIIRFGLKSSVGGTKKKQKGRKDSLSTITNQFAAITKPVPEVNFALNCGCTFCPPITVYYPQTVHRQIQSIMSHYLEDHIRPVRIAETVAVSELVYNCYKDFGSTRKEAVWYFSENFLPHEQSKDILAILQKTDKIQQIKHDGGFEVKFDQKLLDAINGSKTM